jgi:long-chain fatty acid transport protein
MPTRFFRGVFCLLCLGAGFSLPRPAEPAWIESLGLSARASAMGNAYIAVADDLSAVWYNPAGLTQLIGGKRFDSVLGASFNTLVMNIREPVSSPTTGATGYSSDIVPYIPFVRSALGLEVTDRCYIAPLPLYITFGGGAQFSETQGDARFTGYNVAELFIDWMPSVAVKVHKKVSLGFSVNVNAFNQIKDQTKLGDGYLLGGASALIPGTTPEDLTGNPFLSALFLDGQDDGKLLIRTDGEFPTGIRPVNDVDINFRDVGFGVGILANPIEWLRIGVKYRSEMRVHTEGTIALEVNPNDPLVRLSQAGGPLPAITDDTERFEFVFALPQQVGVGVAIQATGWLLWSVDYTWTNWAHAQEADNLFVQGDGLGPSHVKKFYLPQFYEDVNSVRTGVEVQLTPALALQGGFWYDPSPVPTEYWDVGGGFSDYFIFSAGIGYRGLFDGRLDINGSFQYLVANERYIGVGEGKNAGGSKFYVDPSQGDSSNRDFSLVIDGHVLVWGLDLTFHL